MKGRLDLDSLRTLIESDEIDTVLVCIPDMQGRLVGKRVTGHFFLSHGVEELHVCGYLLALDMDMEPVPGYKAASWELGYGDISIRADLSTLRRVAWLPGTALVLGDCTDHQGKAVEAELAGDLRLPSRDAQKVLLTAKKAQFTPASKDGVPVKTWTEIVIGAS